MRGVRRLFSMSRTNGEHEPGGEAGADGPPPYALVPDDLPEGPPLPGVVSVGATADDVIDFIASDLVLHAQACVRHFGDFQLALSGGAVSSPLFRRLMVDPNCRKLPWRRTHLWLVDEFLDADSETPLQFDGIRETIVEHSDIPRHQVHAIPVHRSRPERSYDAQVREVLAWREKGQDRLDFVLLTIGREARSASLDPHDRELEDERRFFRAVDRPDEPMPRQVAMTRHLVRSARFIAVLMLGDVRSGGSAANEAAAARFVDLPSESLLPLDGILKWYLDAAACHLAAGIVR